MMKTISERSEGFLEEKGSKFLSFLTPYSEYEKTLQELKEKHPKARHFVTAFRYLNQHNQIVEGSSDDGEPRGSSGKPILKVLQGHNLINVGVIVVRYFGGTLLGVGGLVRAYSNSVNLAIGNSNLIPYENLIEDYIETDYSQSSKAEYLFKKYGIEVIERDFLNGIRYKIRAPKKEIEKVAKEL